MIARKPKRFDRALAIGPEMGNDSFTALVIAILLLTEQKIEPREERVDEGDLGDSCVEFLLEDWYKKTVGVCDSVHHENAVKRGDNDGPAPSPVWRDDLAQRLQ